MKSKINMLADFREAPFEKTADIRCPEEHLQKKLRALTRSGKTTIPADTVQQGDAVLLTLESAMPRFNRSLVPVAVGSGLYSKELEDQLIGRRAGESFSCTVDGQPVSVTIREATRTVFPEPTDALAAAYAAGHPDMEGVQTVADYCSRVKEQYQAERRDDVIHEAMDACINYVLSHSDWDFDEDEIRAAAEQEIESERQTLQRDEGLDFDAITDKDVRRVFGYPDKKTLMESFYDDAEAGIAISLWQAAAHGVDAATAPMEALEDLEWDFLEEYVSQAITFQE